MHPRARQPRARHPGLLWIALASVAAASMPGCDSAGYPQLDDASESGTSSATSDGAAVPPHAMDAFTVPGPDDWPTVVDPTPVPTGTMLAMVQVRSSEGTCSGMLIADDRVLTAGHCFCGDDYVGANDCAASARVTFQPDPNNPGTPVPPIFGLTTVHEGYNPSWVHRRIEDDIAIVDLDVPAPAYITPLDIDPDYVGTGASVQIVGFGKTGASCNGNAGTLNFDIASVSGYEDNSKIMRFNDQVVCEGDSGGPVLSGDTILGIHSFNTWTWQWGWVSKSIAVAQYYDWIHERTCNPSFWSRCDGKGPICRCDTGGADCDFDTDCLDGLECAMDVGATFGFSPSADVCVAPGPLQGSCGCVSSGLGNICIAGYNGCSGGFVPSCNPSQFNCGACSCQ